MWTRPSRRRKRPKAAGRKRPAIERAKALRAIAAKIREHVEPLARVIAEEQGKLLGLARVEVVFTADYMDYMAEWARRIEGEISRKRPPRRDHLPVSPAHRCHRRHPSVELPVLSDRTQGCPSPCHRQHHRDQAQRGNAPNAVKFRELVAETDLPPGVINIVHGRGSSVGKALAAIRASAWSALRAVSRRAPPSWRPAAPNITKVSLELGGKAPAIVMADADMELPSKAVKASRVINSGQVCNCAERVYVQRASPTSSWKSSPPP